MNKNRQIIQEQKEIMTNYKSNYEKLYGKYKDLKEKKYKAVRAENKQ